MNARLRTPLLAVCHAAAALAAPACTDRDPGTGLDRADFVDVMVELRRAEAEARSAEEFERARSGILQSRGIEPATLHEFVERNGADVRLMTEIWDSIEARLEAVPDSGVA